MRNCRNNFLVILHFYFELVLPFEIIVCLRLFRIHECTPGVQDTGHMSQVSSLVALSISGLLLNFILLDRLVFIFFINSIILIF
jgi:hypothetical protein